MPYRFNPLNGTFDYVPSIRALEELILSVQRIAEGAAEAAFTAQDGVDELNPLVIPVGLTWQGANLTLTRSGTIEYDGADVSVELVGIPPHVPGSVVSIKFPAGSITGANVVTLADSMGPLDSQDDGEDFNPALDYYVVILALSTQQLMTTCRAEVVRDMTAPEITAATVSGDDPNTINVTTSESVIWSTITGFTCAGHTITGVSGSGTGHALTVTEAFTPEEVTSLVWDGTNTVVDTSSNPLAAGSIVVTNNIGYPEINSVTVNATVCTIVWSEACDAVSLDVGAFIFEASSGTPPVLDSLTSGAGTDTWIFALNPPALEGQTLILDVSAGSGVVSSATAFELQAVSGVAVTNDTAAYLWEDDFDRADGPLDNGWATTGEASIASNALLFSWNVGGFQRVWNMCGEVLPADVRVTWTIPHSTVSSTYWGIGCRFNLAGATGVSVFFEGPTNVYCANTSGYQGAPLLEITVTGGFPVSWSVNQNHTAGIEMVGTAGRLLLDGVEYGTFICSTNSGTPGLGICIVGEGQNRSWLDVVVEAP